MRTFTRQGLCEGCGMRHLLAYSPATNDYRCDDCIDRLEAEAEDFLFPNSHLHFATRTIK